MSKETYRESKVCAYIEAHENWYAVKLLKRSGWPDRLVIGPGPTVYFIEFKVPGEKPNELQAFVHKLLRRIGLKVYVCKTIEAGKESVRRKW